MRKWSPRGFFADGGAGLLVVMMSCFAHSLNAQENQQVQLEQLRQRISRLQEQVAAQEKSESSALGFLRTMDEQIELTSRLVGQMKREEQKTRQNIATLEKSLQKNEGELKRLRQLSAKRMVYFYKYGRMREIELLLSARSVSQIVHWAEFQQRLSDNERRIIAGISEKKAIASKQRGQIANELDAQQRLLSEKQRDEETLRKQRAQRQDVLKKVRKDKAYYKMQLAESEKAAVRIKELIAKATIKEEESPSPFINTVDFGKLRGNLPWPLDGKIISQYGTYRHPVLKTETQRLGIDIAAQAGSEVRCVAPGKVTAITWQRGHGNLLIVSHSSGYFTIYTHLAEIMVTPDEPVDAGHVLGTIADNGSEGAILHFEVWQRFQHMNPEEWLR